MISFRQKILLSYLLVFLLFIAFMFPFASRTVKQIVIKGMQDRAAELITRIESAPNNDALIRRLKEQKPLIFFRVSVITNEKKVLYDSHTKRLLGPRFSQEYVVDHPEVTQAFAEGVGYTEDYSELLAQKFAYMAMSFDFHGKPYVMRIAFPYKYVSELTHDFEIGFIGSALAVLLLFSLMTWLIINLLSRPIFQIISAIKPYQEGASPDIPEIILSSSNTKDEFGQLASTLNSLSARIRNQIRSLTEERNEKEAILESLVEGVVAIDKSLMVTYANQSALKFLGMDGNALLGSHFSITKQSICQALLIECQKENNPLTDTLQIKGNGPTIFLDIVAAPKKDDSGAILVLQDKTAHYKILDMRKDFIANASHELKTPITIIRGFAETLHDHPELPEKTLIDVTGKIVKNCERMTVLIQDLLALTDIENLPPSRLVRCDLLALLKQASENIRRVHETAVIRIDKTADAAQIVIGDPSLLEMAVTNLIENAAKYSTPPADITIQLENAGEYVKLRISDKGIGIPPADLDHIFERFYTVNKAHSRKMGGSGLGLSIVETIILKHFGKIFVESEMGKGTTFTILLPLKHPGFNEHLSHEVEPEEME
jgi:two-component system phosphate regulon sensor histidine kinase PhoR